MSDEIEGSNVKYNAFYRDDSCKELEEILREDSKFRENIVEREHYGDVDFDNDPYIIKDAEGKEIFMLEKWELDALNPSELRSYLNVQQKRSLCVDWSERAAYNLFVVSVLVGIMFSIVSFAFYLDVNYLRLMGGILIVTYSIMFGSAILYFLKHKKSNLKKHEIDLKEAESNPSFLKALQKLAAVPKLAYDFVYNEEHIERLEHIESVKAGALS